MFTKKGKCLFACSDKDTSYEVVKNDLRAPAYPLVTIDPYASAWSMSDNLYDSPVRHWTGKDFPLIGVVNEMWYGPGSPFPGPARLHRPAE